MKVVKHGFAKYGNATSEERDVHVILTNRGLFLLENQKHDKNVLKSCTLKYIQLDRSCTQITSDPRMMKIHDDESNYLKFEGTYSWMCCVYQVLDGVFDMLQIHTKDSCTNDVAVIMDDTNIEMVSRDIANHIICCTNGPIQIEQVNDLSEDDLITDESEEEMLQGQYPPSSWDFFKIPLQQADQDAEQSEVIQENFEEEIDLHQNQKPMSSGTYDQLMQYLANIGIKNEQDQMNKIEEMELADALQWSIQDNYNHDLLHMNKSEQVIEEWEFELDEDEEDIYTEEIVTPTSPHKEDVIFYIGDNDERILLGEGTFKS
jgi:hypothetical protein